MSCEDDEEQEIAAKTMMADSLKERLRRIGCKTSGCELTRYEALARIEELEAENQTWHDLCVAESKTIAKLEAENKQLRAAENEACARVVERCCEQPQYPAREIRARMKEGP